MNGNSQKMSIGAKKLGVLLRDARQTAGKTQAESAEALGADASLIEAYEMGEASPSLPELEMLAFFFDVPLEHFWGSSTLAERQARDHKYQPRQLLQLRQRMIGVQLRMARIQAGLSVERLAEKTGLPVHEIEGWELGEGSPSLPDLEKLAQALSQPVSDYLDQHGPVGVWAMRNKALDEFMQLPPELQAFVTKPVNRPYLELALRLSEMSVDKLRAVAEGLLEITL